MIYGPIQKSKKGEDSGKEITQWLQLALEKSGSLGSSSSAGESGIIWKARTTKEMPKYVSCCVSLSTNTFRNFSYLTFYKMALPKPPLARASTFDPSLYELNYFAREPVKHLMEITVQLINEVLPRLPGNRFLVFFFCKEGGQKREKKFWKKQFATFDYVINWIRFTINC